MSDTPRTDSVEEIGHDVGADAWTWHEMMKAHAQRLERELAEARAVLAEIANQGYRGNRNTESQLAWQYINATLGRKEEGEVGK